VAVNHSETQAFAEAVKKLNPNKVPATRSVLYFIRIDFKINVSSDSQVKSVKWSKDHLVIWSAPTSSRRRRNHASLHYLGSQRFLRKPPRNGLRNKSGQIPRIGDPRDRIENFKSSSSTAPVSQFICSTRDASCKDCAPLRVLSPF
jgi:hypothetical protein